MRRPDWTRDPAAPSLALFAALVAGGLVTIGLGWRVAARTLVVAYQVPALVSGAMGGLALVLIGAALAHVQDSRRLAAREREATEALLAELAETVSLVQGRQR
jgi:hypothetical protein